MPLSQLMRKLAGRESPRQGQAVPGLTTGTMVSEVASMDCHSCYHLAVTAEIVPMQDGRRSPCSPSSSTSSHDLANEASAGPFGRLIYAQDVQTGSDMRVGSLPSSLLSAASHPAAARAMRAKSKASLRSSTLETEGLPSTLAESPFSPRTSSQLQHQPSGGIDRLGSGSSSCSMDAQLSHMCSSPASYSYQRSATDPLPNWTSGLTVNTSSRVASATAAAGSDPNVARISTPAAVVEELDEGLDSPVVSPSSAGAVADDAFWCEDCDLHCDWEDGIVASWFKDTDHNELLEMLHSEDEVQPPAAEPVRMGSNVSVQAVYSSALYS